MLNTGVFGLSAVAFCLLSLRLVAGDENAVQEAVEAARGRAESLLGEAKVPGLSVAVGVGDGLVWSEAFGLADREAKTPATPQTIYRIGSVSKLLSVGALGTLLEQGRIELDAPISKYLPDCPAALAKITSRQLAGHLAGVRHYNGLSEVVTQRHCDTVAAALEVFKDDPLLHDAGSKYSYSSYGYVLMSKVIEQAAGKPFLDVVDASVLAPLKLTNTHPEETGSPDPTRSAFYMSWQGNVASAPAMDVSCRWAAGGFHSTAEDLARFLLAHVNAGWLKPETVELLFTPQRLNDNTPTKVGLGWRIATDSSGRRFVHHGGDIAGGRSFVLLYPYQKVAVAICCNLGGAGFAEKEALEIIAPFLAGR